MYLELSIEESMEAFGRENIARYIQNGLQMDHSAAIRIALSKEDIRAGLIPRELTDLRLKIQGAGNTMMPPRPKKRKLKALEFNGMKADDLISALNGALKVNTQHVLRREE